MKIMIVTGEASGDLHGANLVRALQSRSSDLSFCGMGGSELKSLGVEILFDAAKVSVVGIVEVLARLKDIFSAQSVLKKRMVQDPPDLLILIDLPDFNLLLAKKAKKLNIPVFYYIPPQVWAWRQGRTGIIRDRTDKVGVILPFEESFLKERGVDARYVGHPLLDSVRTTLSREEFYKKYNIAPGRCCIGLLPGSRKQEVRSLLPVFLEAAEIITEKKGEQPPVFLVPLASTLTENDLDEAGLNRYRAALDVRVVADDNYNLMNSCRAVVAASGTVTLELAILSTPMVIVYKLSKITYILAKLLVKLEHFSLVNLIAGKSVVTELLQDEVKAKAVAEQLLLLVGETEERKNILQSLAGVRKKLGGAGASEKAADLVFEILDENS
ncbi:lipid-A-disaccharide synthase [Desulfomarina sp.]